MGAEVRSGSGSNNRNINSISERGDRKGDDPDSTRSLPTFIGNTEGDDRPEEENGRVFPIQALPCGRSISQRVSGPDSKEDCVVTVSSDYGPDHSFSHLTYAAMAASSTTSR